MKEDPALSQDFSLAVHPLYHMLYIDMDWVSSLNETMCRKGEATLQVLNRNGGRGTHYTGATQASKRSSPFGVATLLPPLLPSSFLPPVLRRLDPLFAFCYSACLISWSLIGWLPARGEIPFRSAPPLAQSSARKCERG